MADITLSPQQVMAAEANQPSLDPNSAAQQGVQQVPTDVLMPGARLGIQDEAGKLPENQPIPLPGQQGQNPAEAPQSYTLTADQLNQLVASLTGGSSAPAAPANNGLPSIDQLGVPAAPAIPPVVPGVQQPAPQQQQPPAQTPQFEVPANDPAAQQFKQQFEQYLGFPLEQLKTYSQQYQSAVQEIQSFKQQQYYDSSVKSLAQEWGVNNSDAQQRLVQIQSRFQQYDPDMQSKLDNVEGAKLIWARLQQEQQQQQAMNQVPQFQQSSARVPNLGQNRSQVMFTQQQLDTMPREEYEQRADEIYYAYANGLVK